MSFTNSRMVSARDETLYAVLRKAKRTSFTERLINRACDKSQIASKGYRGIARIKGGRP